MPDPSAQLRALVDAGFELQAFERYPKAVGALRDGCIALLEATAEGLRMVGRPGWRMGEVLGVLVEEGGRRVFRAKAEAVEATAERLEILRRFTRDLEGLLKEPPG